MKGDGRKKLVIMRGCVKATYMDEFVLYYKGNTLFLLCNKE